MKGAATSAATMNHRPGIRRQRGCIVEGGKWISYETLKRSIEEGIQFFNANRPGKLRII
jgi:hypothetical protein